MTAKTRTKLSWKHEQIVVQVKATTYPGGKTRTTTKTIDADVWGTFAVHEPVSSFAFGWDVTHRPSGYVLLHSARSRAAARQFCAEVADVTDWSTLTAGNARERWPEMRERVIDAAKRARP